MRYDPYSGRQASKGYREAPNIPVINQINNFMDILPCLFNIHFINILPYEHKWQSNPITGLDRSWGFQEDEAPRFQDNRHMKVVRLSALRTGRLYPSGNIPATNFCQRLSRPQDHIATGRIMSTKNSNDTIGNRTRDLPACNAVPQPTAPPRNPI